MPDHFPGKFEVQLRAQGMEGKGILISKPGKENCNNYQ